MLETSPKDLNCLIKRPGTEASFDVSFVNSEKMEKFLQRYRMRKNELPLKHFLAEPLSDREIKVVTIQFYNESVHEYDVETWLKRYCQVTSSCRKVVDRDGVWNGARQWLIQLFKDPEGIGGVRHLPSNVTLGAARGFVVYNGMPKLCRNCGQLGHLAVSCSVTKCKNCGGPHVTALCHEEKHCNLCGEEGHVFKNCPDLYTNIVKGQRVTQQQDVEREEEASKERTEEQQDEDGSLEEDPYSSEFSENEPDVSAEEDNADNEMEIIQQTGKRKHEEQAVAKTRKKVGGVNIAPDVVHDQERGHLLAHIGKQEKCLAVISSPDTPTRGLGIERTDFQGSTFLEEGDVQTFSAVSVFLKSAVVAEGESDKVAATCKDKDKMAATNKAKDKMAATKKDKDQNAATNKGKDKGADNNTMKDNDNIENTRGDYQWHKVGEGKKGKKKGQTDD
ncbi:UNVERIFIED_CONTAM: hypothetical protein FKN15_062509 [Acipenser sinensis]